MTENLNNDEESRLIERLILGEEKVYVTGQMNDDDLVNRLYKAGVKKINQEIPQ